MTYIKIAGQQYPATISGKKADREWDDRESKAITLEMDYATAASLFVDGAEWSIIYQADSYTDPEAEEVVVTPEPIEYDNSEFYVAGPITDNRDGTVTVKMGQPTAAEMLAELQEVLTND